MEKALLAAADDRRFDVFLMAYNFLQMDQGKRVLEVCKEKKIGTVLTILSSKGAPTSIIPSIATKQDKMTKVTADAISWILLEAKLIKA